MRSLGPSVRCLGPPSVRCTGSTPALPCLAAALFHHASKAYSGGGRSNERGRISGAQHVMTVARGAGSSAQHVVACRNHAVGASRKPLMAEKNGSAEGAFHMDLAARSRQVRRLWKGFLPVFSCAPLSP